LFNRNVNFPLTLYKLRLTKEIRFVKTIYRFLIVFSAFAVGLQGAERLAGEIAAKAEDKPQITVQTERGDDVVTVSLGRGDAAIYEVGDRIRGELVRFGAGQRLQTIWPNDPAGRGTIANLTRRLHRDTLNRGRKVFRGVGEKLPVFALWDQNGDLFLSESLKDTYVVMNFVFTRCPVPEMCPAATQRMVYLDQLLDEAGLEDVKLVSITLDPLYDTPGIWKAYEMDKAIDGSRHSLLGGPELAVESLKQQMGVLAEEDPEEIIRHTMSTALIAPGGEIIYRIPGSRWKAETFIRQIERHREG